MTKPIGITYRHDGLQPFKITVFLDGKIVGTIKRDGSEYFYQPEGTGWAGPYHPSAEAVKRDLEAR